jgi:mono/diheme cytochrome c family protein
MALPDYLSISAKYLGCAMKRFWRFFLIGIIGLVIFLVAAITLTIGWRPFLGPRTRALTDRKFESTPERLARGRYLATAVMGCLDCHSQHDWKAEGGPLIPSMLGAGQLFPGDLPGTVFAPNITSESETGAGSWSDDQLARAIREGISHDGQTLFPLMPYENFRSMSDEDLAAVVVYLRTLPAVRNPLPRTQIVFPVKYMIRSAPQPVESPVPAQNSPDPLKRGEYLVRMASCAGCHTMQERGQPNQNLAFAGGFVFSGPFGEAAAANITPDPSGISYYDENLFISVMRTGKVEARTLNPIMPWVAYRGMTDDDLKAIFAYLRTLKPVHHRVDNREPPTACKLCRGKHGAGDQN